MDRSPRTPVVVLVGPKGAGKSTLGRALEHAGFARFVDVESIFLALPDDQRTPEIGYRALLRELENEPRAATIELTGAAPEALELIEELRARRPVRLIRVDAPKDLCIERVKERDPAGHLPSDDALVAEVHRRSAALELNYDLAVDGAAPFDVPAIAIALRLDAPS